MENEGANCLVQRGCIPVYIGLICAIGHGEDNSIRAWWVGLMLRERGTLDSCLFS